MTDQIRRIDYFCVTVPDRPGESARVWAALRTAGFKLSGKKTGFLIQDEDRPGGVADAANRLVEANIHITSTQVFSAGSGRRGGMLWVGASDLRRAAKALGATSCQTPEVVSKAAGYPSPFDEQ